MAREGFILRFFPSRIMQGREKKIWIFFISFREKCDSVPISAEKGLFFFLRLFFMSFELERKEPLICTFSCWLHTTYPMKRERTALCSSASPLMFITAVFLHWGTERFELKLQRQLTKDYSV